MAKGQKGLTCWVKPLPEGLPQRIMDCPVLPCILPRTAFPCYTETHNPGKNKELKGRQARAGFWEAMRWREPV